MEFRLTKVAIREANKYSRMWMCDDYATYSPGEQWLGTFLDLVKEEAFGRLPGTVLDIGCGTGRAGKQLEEKGFTVSYLDIVDVREDREGVFYWGNLWSEDTWQPIGKMNYGYCCDVMEHIPTEYVGLTLDTISHHCTRAFFTISLMPDQFGLRIGEPLHLTVQPFMWWRDCLKEFGDLIDARDCLDTGVFYLRGRCAD